MFSERNFSKTFSSGNCDSSGVKTPTLIGSRISEAKRQKSEVRSQEEPEDGRVDTARTSACATTVRTPSTSRLMPAEGRPRNQISKSESQPGADLQTPGLGAVG